jgi:hypothetical protein
VFAALVAPAAELSRPALGEGRVDVVLRDVHCRRLEARLKFGFLGACLGLGIYDSRWPFSLLLENCFPGSTGVRLEPIQRIPDVIHIHMEEFRPG